LGNETAWTYDQAGNQLTETDAKGNITTSTYNQKGEILTQMDPAGIIVINNQYSPNDNPFLGGGNLTKVSDALGNFTEFHWTAGQDSDLNTVVVNTGFTDAKGNRFNISPITGGANNGLNGASTDLNGLKIETTYDDEAQPLTESQVITDENGVEIARYTTTFEYNANGDIIKTTDALGNVSTTEYNQLNKVSAIVDANGNRTEFTFDNRGNPSKTTYADGTFETTQYDNENNVIASTDRAGRVTKTIYDAANRVSAVILADDTPADDTDNPRTTNTYDAAGRLIAVTDANGNTTGFEYDSIGRRTKTTDALGNQTKFIYDNLGRRIQSTDALARATKFEYNQLGKLTKTIFPDNTPNDDSDNLTTTTTYDKLSRKTVETDLADISTNYEYNKGGSLTAVIDALGQRTEYTYDQRGNKISQKDANGSITTWAFDELSRLASRTLPKGQTETFTYNNLGNLASKTDFNGDTTIYEYNNLNQQVKIIYADNTEVTSTYTATGQIASITQTQGTTSYQYDAQNRLTRIDYPTGNFIAYQYDKNGNRTQLQTASQTVDYTFDALNRMASVSDTTGVTTYAYDSVGNRATQVNSNGTKAIYSYDLLNRLSSLVHTNSSGTIIASYQYTLGANGNRQSITEATGRVVDYTYDSLYRLLTEEVTDPINGNHSSQWSYDAVGNRLQQLKDGTITTFSYNNNDQILSETKNNQITSYTYDNNGNTLSKSIDGTLNTSYSYNKDNRLLQVITPTSTIINSYDLAGIRQSQSVDGTLTHYLVDPNRSYAQVLEEQNASNIPKTTYVYGDDLISQINAQGTHTYAYDGLGSTRVLTDVTGAVQNSYGYEAFGELDYQFGNVENHYLFTGEQYDNNVGFYYLRARFYNASNGRFTQLDTFQGMAFEPKTLHKYLYTGNNPIDFVDPSGNMFLNGLIAVLRLGLVNATRAVIGFGNIIYRAAARTLIYTQSVIWRRVLIRAGNLGRKLRGLSRGIFQLRKHLKRWTKSDKFRKASKNGKHNIEVWSPSGLTKVPKKSIGPFRIWRNIRLSLVAGGKGGRVLQIKYTIGKNGAGKVGGGFFFLFRLDYLDFRQSPPTSFPHYHIQYNGIKLDHVPIS
jgi:RHS repeat-associated protein